MVTKAAEPTVEATTEEEMPLVATTSAWSPGEVVNTWEGEPYTSITGHKYALMKFSFMRYYSDGTKKIITSTQASGYTNNKYYVGNTLAYCIESGKAFDGGDYTSGEAGTSDYLKLLSPTAREGIMLAMLYGYNPENPSYMPTESEVGCAFNVDDFAFATQIIIWEYQSGIRTSPTSISALSYGGKTIEADNYVKWIEGHPAKNCYDWMLDQMAEHRVIPSFASTDVGLNMAHTMQYDAISGKYTVTLTDTNNTGCDITFPSTSGITVSRQGNTYTFSTTQEITDPVTLTVRKNVPQNTGALLIWSNGVGQTLATGVQDPVVFYLQLRTQPLGMLTIHKSGQGDQDLSGVKLQLLDDQGNVLTWSQQADGRYAALVVQNGQFVEGQETDTLITDEEGRVELVNIPFGSYTLQEIQTEECYQLLPQPVTITLPYGVAGAKDTTSDEVYYSNGTNYYYHLTYDLRNTLVYRLPATGGYAVWLMSAGLALAFLCVTGLAMHKKHQTEH
ncbi:MAG TPA: Cys-Gln thioester bond-forming surface protein [Candidatus Enterenecus faecium]|uniref:Cys-Gln thioester bond-forming surface protein n=1 Tax=Candidatus Enterenecus faecium TaxID=2840780 RepID=A0A9D1CGI8_9FIRM|nr:Cys-Gln thioester bond-forming surface protein [Candidatus Enterenecus faecium]